MTHPGTAAYPGTSFRSIAASASCSRTPVDCRIDRDLTVAGRRADDNRSPALWRTKQTRSCAVGLPRFEELAAEVERRRLPRQKDFTDRLRRGDVCGKAQ